MNTANQNQETVKVIFRKDRRKDGDVLAVFPAIASTVGQPQLMQCYMLVGQHGACAPEYIRTCTRPATLEESARLRAELVRIGYQLREVNRASRADYLERVKQTRR